ncbi:PREDICTED: dipeptidyl peptidase 3 [Condylura cristata]|uniref:dipeptidyl peptidase 3 n=1 Tax=Condylura cristata TaxID=143302 RepID=UPI000643A216|nr:PREDICTED: dipeptidyl peptidase 3 [Condylura cristata]
MADTQYILPSDIGVSSLDCREAFRLLSPTERLYAHHLSRAAWYGGLAVLLQTSPEAPYIYALLSRLFRAQDPDQLRQHALAEGLTEEEYQAFLVYTAGVYSNMGNYKSFGDTKFVPNLPKEKLERVVLGSEAARQHPEEVRSLWQTCGDLMFSLEPRLRHLGLGEAGVTTYFSGDCTMEDAKLAQDFLDSQNLSAYNTRLFKELGQDGKPRYEVRLASVLRTEPALDSEVASKLKGYEFQGSHFQVTRGDYAPILQKVVEHLEKAKAYAANSRQEQMLAQYAESFTQGSIEAHKRASRSWIQDRDLFDQLPSVYFPVTAGRTSRMLSLCCLHHPVSLAWCEEGAFRQEGFVAPDPWPGFVAMVNKAMSAKFECLVASAEQLLKELPWPPAFEKDKFLTPDFTSLDVLTFAGSGIPAGINIPNYDDLRQTEGFKNVSLGNVLAVAYATKREKLTFLEEDDKDLYIRWKGPSFDVQVGLHELLGHGSGKLFVQDEKGAFNFDQETVINPETGEQIQSWYRSGETWDSKFSTIASSYEECRAESVGLYLCLNPHVLEIFGFKGADAEDVIYVNWLNMVRAGLLALEFYTPQASNWRQAHMQARFVILRVLLEAGEGLVTVTPTTGADGRPDARVRLDRSKIRSVGKPALERFLRKLQVLKSTGDVAGGRALYEGYAAVTDAPPECFLTLRDTVLLRKESRKLIVQPNTRLEGKRLLSALGAARGDHKGVRDGGGGSRQWPPHAPWWPWAPQAKPQPLPALCHLACQARALVGALGPAPRSPLTPRVRCLDRRYHAVLEVIGLPCAPGRVTDPPGSVSPLMGQC